MTFKTLVVKQIFFFLLWLAFPLLASAENPHALVRITPGKNATFTVEYRFPQEITHFRFQAATAIRQTSWTARSPDLLLTDSGVSSKDGSPFTVAVFELKSPQKSTLRAYDPIIELTDGSAALYSEYLMLNTEDWVTHFQIQPAPNQLAIIEGAIVRERIDWQDRQRGGYVQGHYIYFGTLTPQHKQDVHFLYDPATPTWIRKDLETTANAVVKFYARNLAKKAHPFILVSLSNLDDAGFNHRGDTLPGQFVRLGLYGRGWENKTEEKQNRLRKLIAHELFHIWNAEYSKPTNAAGQIWMHEGAAEYAALRALTSLNLITSQHALDTLNHGINQCTLGMAEQSLNQVASTSNQQHLFYDCGLLNFYLIDAKITQDDSRRSIFTFFSHLFRNTPYSQEQLLSMIKHDYHDARLAEFISNMSIHAYPSILGDLTQWLSRMRHPFSLSDAGRARNVYIQALMAQILKADCKNGVGYWMLSEGVKIDSAMDCASFKNSPTVSQVMGWSLVTHPKEAYVSAQKACATNNPILFSPSDQSQKINYPCALNLRDIPDEIYLERL